MIDAAHPAIRAVNDDQVVLTLGTGAVEVFERGWKDSPSHPLGCQEKILEAIRGAWPERERRGAYRRRWGGKVRRMRLDGENQAFKSGWDGLYIVARHSQTKIL